MTPELREKLLAFGNGAEPFLQHNHFCVEDVDDGTSSSRWSCSGRT